MKNIKKHKMIYTLIILLLFGLVSYLMFNQIVKETLDIKKVPIVTSTLLGGTEITKEDIRYIDVPNNVIVDGVLIDEKNIVGKVVDYGGTLVKGSLIYSELIKEKSDVKNADFFNLEKDQIAFTLRVDKETSYAHSIQVGNKIDLYFSGTGVESEDEKEKVIYGELVKQAEVLSIYSDELEGYSEDSEAFLVVALTYADADLIGRAKVFGTVFPMISYDAIHEESNTLNYYNVEMMRDAIYQRTIDITLYEVIDE